MLKAKALNNEVKRNKIYPVYLLIGEEEEDKREIIDLVIDNLSKDSGEVEKYTFFGDEVEISKILDELQTYSFFDYTKVVVVKNAEKLNFNESFYSYIRNPNAKSVLFLLSGKNDISHKLQRAVEKSGRVVKFWKNFQDVIEMWLITELKNMNIKTDIKTVRYIIEITGNQKADILNQIKTISNFLKEGESLDVEKVKNIVSRIAKYTVFDLINSIFIKDSIELIKIFRTLIKNGEELTIINYFIWKYLKTLLTASSYKMMGYTDTQIVSALDLNKKKLMAKRVMGIISKISYDNLIKLMNYLDKIDYITKTKPKYVSIMKFEEFLLKLGEIGR